MNDQTRSLVRIHKASRAVGVVAVRVTVTGIHIPRIQAIGAAPNGIWPIHGVQMAMVVMMVMAVANPNPYTTASK